MCQKFGGAILCSTTTHTVKRHGVYFDFSPMFGPLWLKADGTEYKNQNGTHKQWGVFNDWFREEYQGIKTVEKLNL